MNGIFRDRTQAGQVLAPKLREFAHRSDASVIALSRGGVPVAFQVARKLHVPLDLLLVRKLRVSAGEELAFGAVTSDGVEFHDQPIIAALAISAAGIADVVRSARSTLETEERACRGSRSHPAFEGRTVILVDDGIATGLTMRAGLRAVNLRRARSIVIAAPVASVEAVETLRHEVASVVTVVTAERLFEVAEYFRNFRPPTDEEIKSLLARNTVADVDDKTAAA
jgi:putative phosphoribosyl transferase